MTEVGKCSTRVAWRYSDQVNTKIPDRLLRPWALYSATEIFKVGNINLFEYLYSANEVARARANIPDGYIKRLTNQLVD